MKWNVRSGVNEDSYHQTEAGYTIEFGRDILVEAIDNFLTTIDWTYLSDEPCFLYGYGWAV